MSSGYLVNVPKLQGRENYDDWAFAAQNFLVLEGLKKYIETEPDRTKDDEVEQDAKTMAKLILMIDPSLYVHVKDAITTQSLWNKLKAMFDDSGFARRISLLRHLISTRLENCDSMVSYVNQVIETSQRLRGTGFKIDDEWVGSLLLAGLPEKYMPMIMAIEHSGMLITTDSIKSKLIDMENDFAGNAGSAFYVKRQSGGTRVATPMTGAGKGNQSYKDRSQNKKIEIQCFKCKKKGHYRNQCPLLKDSNKQNSAENAFSAIFLTGDYKKSDWYVDSGASAHIVVDKQSFARILPCETREIMVANSSVVKVTDCGDVNIKTIVDKETFDVTVKNALCVPKVSTNLLSVSQLLKNGNQVLFEMNCCNIFNQNNKLIATADLVGGVYKLNICQEPEEQCLLAVSSEVWHKRLGHINSVDFNKMRNGAVMGLNCSDKKKIGMCNCVVCCEGKQPRLPFNHKGTRAEAPLEVVHGDLCGPMETKSIGGSRYFFLLVDDYTRMCFVYFLAAKDEVVKYFKIFKTRVENQLDLRIKTFRSDNGGEFVNRDFDDFLRSHGISHQRTNAYTPQQNGMSERLNRSIVEKARCMLFNANLEKKFWAEAVNTAVHIRNRCTVSGLNGKTPYEMWTKKKPDVSYFRIFGSMAMVHVVKEKRKKWDRKSSKKILVGYDQDVKGFRVYDPVSNTVTTSKDVIVFENNFSTVNVPEANEDVEVSVSVGDYREAVVENEPLHQEEELSANSENFETLEIVGELSSESTDALADTDVDTDSDFIPEIDINVQPVERLQRERKPKDFSDYYTYLCCNLGIVEGDPVTVQEALSGNDKEMWKKAMEEEIGAFEENNAWELVDEPKNSTIVQCKWVFKRKFDSENNVCFRARLVAKGFTQKAGVDYFETFSPVVRFSTLRLLIALSVKLNLDMSHLDVTTAFLNGKLNEKVFMRLPDGTNLSAKQNKVLRLNKAIYGLKQASRAWYERVEIFLEELGYKKCKLEPCLFTKISENSITIVALYVDDFFLFSNNSVEVGILKKKLSENFKVKDLGQLRQCLGMKVTVDREHNIITLDQEQYIDQILQKFNMLNCKPVGTPMEIGIKLEKGDSIAFDAPYQQLIGSLMYLSVLTRPDISYSLSYLSQFNKCYDESHWKCAKRILRYLQRTKSYGLKFCKDDLDIQGYVDADWAGNAVDRKSYTGFCFKLSGSSVSWESRKQNTVALSSTEAEYMAASEASKEAIYFKNLLTELLGFSKCVILFNDNQGAQKLSANPMFHKRSKHIDIRHHFVRDAVSKNLVALKYLQTTDMPADILTKSLSPVKHCKCLEMLGIVDIK